MSVVTTSPDKDKDKEESSQQQEQAEVLEDTPEAYQKRRDAALAKAAESANKEK